MIRPWLFVAVGAFSGPVACGSSQTGVARTGPGGGDASVATGGAVTSGNGGAISGGAGGGLTGGATSSGASGSFAGGAGGTSGTGGSTTVSIFVDILRAGTQGCLPRALPTGPGQTCTVIEASTNPAGTCDQPGRAPLTSAALAQAARSRLEASRLCGAAPEPDCSTFNLCEIVDAGPTCLGATPDPNAIGWCYVDPDAGLGDPSLVATCPSSSRRIIRFVGANTPAQGAEVIITCGNAS